MQQAASQQALEEQQRRVAARRLFGGETPLTELYMQRDPFAERIAAAREAYEAARARAEAAQREFEEAWQKRGEEGAEGGSGTESPTSVGDVWRWSD
jgi:septal ring factor EnvC (AmiA/AmiB activator)